MKHFKSNWKNRGIEFLCSGLGAGAKAKGRNGVAETGLPRSIESNGQEILAAPMAMVVETARGPRRLERRPARAGPARGGRRVLRVAKRRRAAADDLPGEDGVRRLHRLPRSFQGRSPRRLEGHPPGNPPPPRGGRLHDGPWPQRRLSPEAMEVGLGGQPGQQPRLAGRRSCRPAVQAQRPRRTSGTRAAWPRAFPSPGATTAAAARR